MTIIQRIRRVIGFCVVGGMTEEDLEEIGKSTRIRIKD